MPGDLKFDPLGLGNGKSKKELDELRLKELNNGRLAMIAISGMVAQELVDGLNLIPSDVATSSATVACKPWSRPAPVSLTKPRAPRRSKRLSKLLFACSKHYLFAILHFFYHIQTCMFHE